jgi:hypothetical protein
MESKKRKSEALTDPTMPPSSRRGLEAAELRDWASLPSDVLLVILSRIPQADLLCGAGLACASWRRLAVDEPLLWRRIDLSSSNAPAMARTAVDRSAGLCESFHGRVDCDFLRYLADRYVRLASITHLMTKANCNQHVDLVHAVRRRSRASV